MANSKAGDQEAMRLLMRRYQDRVYAVVYRFTGNHEDALDLTQETFIRAFRGLDTFERRSGVYTWLFQIAANLSRNALRDKGRKGRNKGQSLEGLQEAAPGAAQQATAAAHTPRDHAQGRELESALQDCLKGLPEHYRWAFVLRVMEERNYDEIAETLEVPRGTVKSRINQARKRLRDCLDHKEVF